MSNELFERIRDCNSLNVIQLIAEEGCNGVPREDFLLLCRIVRSNDLDEVRLICAERLGDTAEAETLRAWLLKKKARGGR